MKEKTNVASVARWPMANYDPRFKGPLMCQDPRMFEVCSDYRFIEASYVISPIDPKCVIKMIREVSKERKV